MHFSGEVYPHRRSKISRGPQEFYQLSHKDLSLMTLSQIRMNREYLPI